MLILVVALKGMFLHLCLIKLNKSCVETGLCVEVLYLAHGWGGLPSAQCLSAPVTVEARELGILGKWAGWLPKDGAATAPGQDFAGWFASGRILVFRGWAPAFTSQRTTRSTCCGWLLCYVSNADVLTRCYVVMILFVIPLSVCMYII